MTEPIRILYVDDSRLDRALVLDALQQEEGTFTVIEAASRQEFEALLVEGHFEIVLSDFDILGYEGLQVIDAVRMRFPAMPVVIVTGTGSEEIAVEALKRGAADYVIKTTGHIQRLGLTLQSVLEKTRLAQAKQQAEITLQEREAMYRQAISAANGVVYQCDFRKNIYTYMDDSVERLIGYPASEVTPELWHKISHFLELRGEMKGLTGKKAIQRFRAGEFSAWTADYICDGKQGKTSWVTDASIALHDENGEVFGCLGILQDITDRKRTEIALQESEARFRTLLETVQMAAVLLDTEGNITFANNYLLAQVGWTREAVLGKNWFDLFIVPAEREMIRQRFKQNIEQNFVVPQAENHIVARNGELRLISWNNTVLHDEQGQITGTASIGVDITERQRLQEQLLQSQKMEGIGRLAGGVAHDFNNLLTAILGYTELAEETAADLPGGEAVLGYLANVRQASERAANLTSQLLAFARKQMIEPKIVDLNLLVHDMEKLLNRLLGEDIQIITLPDVHLWRTKIDVGQFEQILVNLAVNARDAMPDGGTLTIETQNVTLDEGHTQLHLEVLKGDYVMLAVSDTGAGMERALQDHIFEPFFTTKEIGKGTGMGLATCHGIVRQSGGHIWCYSEPQQGTTFKIYLPRTAEAADRLPVEEAIPVPQGSETILVVEDEPMVRAIGVQTLRTLGYTVLEAGSGPEALAMLTGFTEEIALLLTDVVMPQMSGRQLSEALTKLRPQMKTLYVSGYTDNTVIHHGILEAGIAFLPKPYTPGVLARKVRDVLDAPPGERPE